MKKLKIFLLLSILLCLGFALSSEVHAQDDGPKIFEIDDIISANTIVRISWTNSITGSYFSPDGTYRIRGTYNSENYFLIHIQRGSSGISRFYINTVNTGTINIINSATGGYNVFLSPYTQYGGDHAYCDILIDVPIIISQVDDKMNIFTWELLGDPILQGYNVTYEENGGTTIPDIEEATELPNPLPIPTKSGYTFLGWYYDSSFTNAAVAGDSLSSDVTLYAKWQLNTYTITYNSNGGSSIPQTSYATQLPNPLPIPTRTGYYFQGWFYDSDFINEALTGDPLTSDVTLYAMWTQYNRIFFNTNGGNTIPSIITTDIIPDNLPIPVRSDDIFIGWYYDESLSDPVETNDSLSSNITLYASWIDYDGIVEYFNDKYKDGYDDGYDDTYEDAYNQGYDLGFEYAYPYGYDDGYRDGLMEDHPIEFSKFFDKGYFDAREKYGKLIDDYQWESAQIAYENGQKTMGRYSRILMYGIVIITIIGGVILYYSLKRRNE